MLPDVPFPDSALSRERLNRCAVSSDDWMEHRCELSGNRLEIEWRLGGDLYTVSMAYLVRTLVRTWSVLGPYLVRTLVRQ